MRSLILPILLILAMAPPVSQARDYPTRPVRLIVAAAAGGGNDFVARTIGDKVSEALGQPLVIENKGGAAGLVASGFVANASPDGHTLLLVFANFATFPSLARKPNFDPEKDLVPVSNIGTTPLVLIAPKSLAAKSVAELIQMVKRDGASLNYASPGVGAMGHLAAELFQNMAGIKLNHIPYKGGGPATLALLTGEVQLFFSTPAAAMAQIEAGKLQALGVTSGEPAPFLPGIPAIAASGLPGYEVDGWMGVFAPAGTPAATVDAIQKAFAKAVKDPDIQKRLAKEGVSSLGNTPAEFSAQLKKDIEKWRPIMRTLGEAEKPAS